MLLAPPPHPPSMSCPPFRTETEEPIQFSMTFCEYATRQAFCHCCSLRATQTYSFSNRRRDETSRARSFTKANKRRNESNVSSAAANLSVAACSGGHTTQQAYFAVHTHRIQTILRYFKHCPTSEVFSPGLAVPMSSGIAAVRNSTSLQTRTL